MKRYRAYFCPETYDLTKWNCNNFTDFCVKFLFNNEERGIPKDILSIGEEIQESSVLGSLLVDFVKMIRGENPMSTNIDRDDHPLQELLKVAPGNGKEELLQEIAATGAAQKG